MRRYLIDTNHLGEAVGRVSVVRDRLQQLQLLGGVFGTCGPVLMRIASWDSPAERSGAIPQAFGDTLAGRPCVASRS